MCVTLNHASLGARLEGLQVGKLWKFRGIPYGTITTRFARACPTQLEGKVDCSRYGPRCPQLNFDVRHLLRIPQDIELPTEPENEFQCLNLDVTMPPFEPGPNPQLLPVLVWIHGGSQIATFGSSASGLCDMTRIVSDSVDLGYPFIAVGIQYRLNMFAFGNGKGERNLTLKDQRLAIDWVVEHIGGFGGDPANITLAGESAGAVFCHAHVVAQAPVRQTILSSGTLYLSPPLPAQYGTALIHNVASELEKLGYTDMATAPPDMLLKAQANLGIRSIWIQMEPAFENWENKTGNTTQILIGDVEYESIIWRNGIETLEPGYIAECFNNIGDDSSAVKRLYGILPDRSTSCKTGALDLITDQRFALPVEKVQQLWLDSGKPAYRYLLDQPNPWQPSNRAHHAVDLIFLFGGFETSNPAAETVGKAMRTKWIKFINGRAPWDAASAFAFGPYGEVKSIDQSAVDMRRRRAHLDLVNKVGWAKFNAAVVPLITGRVSLLN
ncbi:alpha/beta-hydrolase [Mytilinidion resinicola]